MRGILQQPAPGIIRPLQLGGHAVERTAERPDLVGPAAQAGTPGEIACGNRGGIVLEGTEGPHDTGGDERTEERGGECRAERDDHDGERRVLLDLGRPCRRAPARRRTSRARAAWNGRRRGHGSLVCLEPREAPIDRERRGHGDHEAGRERDGGERDREAEAQGHDAGRGARYPMPRTVSTYPVAPAGTPSFRRTFLTWLSIVRS